MKIKNQKNAGFTIIELMVATSLFLVIISIVSGVFVKSLRIQRGALGLIEAASNAELAIEQMAREMRTGTTFNVFQESKSVSFKNVNGNMMTYNWNSETKKLECLETGDYSDKHCSSAAPQPITANNVSINNLKFTFFNGAPADPYPPRITITLKIASLKNPASEVNIQTTISSRNLE